MRERKLKGNTKKEQAKANKQTAIFNAIIETAQAVVSQLAEGGFVAAALAGVLGAAQIALIANEPIPQYWSGTDNAKEGLARVDEVRPEVHTDKHGNVKSFGKIGSNLRMMEQGDKIYSSREKYFKEELDGLLGENDIAYSRMMNIGQNLIIESSGLQKDTFVEHIKSLERTIKSKENISVNVDKSGVKVNKGGTELLNNQIRLKGRTV